MTFARLSGLLAPLLFGAVAACYASSSDATAPGTNTTNPSSGGDDDSGASTGTGTTTDTSAFAAGQALAQTYACASCHGADLSGNLKQASGVYSANITPDMDTGIGSWTLANLTSALRDGVDDQGDPICSAMPKFPTLSDGDISNLYAYLQGIPAVSKAQTDTDCEGNPSGDDDDDDDSGAGDAGTGTDAGTDAAADSGSDAGDRCPHKVCVVGAALASSCGSCAATVCSHEPSCCETSWTPECVDVVGLYCETQCD